MRVFISSSTRVWRNGFHRRALVKRVSNSDYHRRALDAFVIWSYYRRITGDARWRVSDVNKCASVLCFFHIARSRSSRLQGLCTIYKYSRYSWLWSASHQWAASATKTLVDELVEDDTQSFETIGLQTMLHGSRLEMPDQRRSLDQSNSTGIFGLLLMADELGLGQCVNASRAWRVMLW